MQAQHFYQVITRDQSSLLERLLGLFETHGVQHCIIGDQAVNAYVEPLVSLDLDVVIAAGQLAAVEVLLEREFGVKRFPHSLHISVVGSDLRVQIQTDPRYLDFPARAEVHDTLGRPLRVASLPDVLQGKIWAAQDSERRGSKRQKIWPTSRG